MSTDKCDGLLFFTIGKINFWLCGEKTTAVVLTSEEGGMGFTQNSNKRNNTSSYKQENYNAILFFLRLINNFLSSLQAECFY